VLVADRTWRHWWFFAAGLVVMSLVFALGAKLVFEPKDATAPPRLRNAATSRPAHPASTDAPPVASEPSPAARPAPEASRPEQVEKAAAGSECSQSADCRGPKLADCIVVTCEAGRCVYDRSSCECALDEECDDGVACTRDVCFAATKKCIHMRSGCE
jgi:hypothetical protein